ncbi:hypothetical protein ECANGB1_1047 [Enterospora canceri]|uniref:Uncharacterized protein n=1 Tax=Enterospora canceri TaxID=1081671 RepID=A0A1Y1S495_9MICR|nr:hypothetical protein ECANGB1_331 [Enterospora canceri]ORD93126.1 hypothetical protein ECANGB1_1047 [Enterospora canceri]
MFLKLLFVAIVEKYLKNCFSCKNRIAIKFQKPFIFRKCYHWNLAKLIRKYNIKHYFILLLLYTKYVVKNET